MTAYDRVTCTRCGNRTRERITSAGFRDIVRACVVCGYGASEPAHPGKRGADAERTLNRNGYRSGDLFTEQ